jgi:sterol desaturase/sphingolipid hydroxylase (fatty acid hydroxylase superfamily)
MEHFTIDARRDAEPIRLFKSDFLEFFTHISPVAIVVVWLPVATWLLVRAVMGVPALQSRAFVPLGFLMGLFLWTLAEYTLHRFVFHYKPRNAWQERISFLFHGIHHAQPQVKTRLVMPLPVSIPLAVAFYALFSVVAGRLLGSPQWIAPVMSGFLIGYLLYDLTHYATHHFAMRSGYPRFIKRYHMQHHYKDPGTRFGVSSPVWDWVFGTAGKGNIGTESQAVGAPRVD